MAEQAVTYVTPEMEEAKGKWSESRTSLPVSASDIRKWAIATYWPETAPRIYWDEEYAKTTKWGGIIAPRDFNPFAWPVERTRGRGGPAPGKRADGKPLTGMNGGQTDTYGPPMRPGDVISARSRLVDWNEREGRLGHTLYTYTELEWRNQDDEVIRSRISIGIRY